MRFVRMTTFASITVSSIFLASGTAARPAHAGFEEYLFKLPANNIYCVVDAWSDLKKAELTCVVISTRQPGLNPQTWLLDTYHRPDVYRPNDAPIQDKNVLRYGQTLRRGPFVCKATFAGLRCTSRLSGHGFFLSRARQTTF